MNKMKLFDTFSKTQRRISLVMFRKLKMTHLRNTRKRNIHKRLLRIKFHVISDIIIKNPRTLRGNVGNIKDINQNRSIFILVS